MFRYISEIIAQFSTPQKVIALSLILLSIVIITIGPSMIESNDELKEEIDAKTIKIKALESELNEKDTKIRSEQKSCTNQILEREKEFVAMLDYLQNKAKKDNNKIISQTNMEFFPVISVSDSLLYSPEPPTQSTIIVKNDMGNIINEIDNLKKKIKH
jgi:hypothetical protein